MKDETRVRGPWADKPIKPKYSGKDLPTTLYAWQTDVLQRCQTEPDDRTVNYIYDPNGNTGKSKFSKYMWYHHGAVFLPWGRTGDILNYVCKNKDAGVFFFDLSRAKPQDWARDDISAAIEQIKNGMIVNMKYETCGVTFMPPHVWVFSNQLPNLSSMSKDRWSIYTITALRELVPYKIRRDDRREGEPIRMERNRSNSPGRDMDEKYNGSQSSISSDLGTITIE